MSWLPLVLGNVAGLCFILIIAGTPCVPAAFALKERLGIATALKALLKGLSLIKLPDALGDVYFQILEQRTQNKTESEKEAVLAIMAPLQEKAEAAIELLQDSTRHLFKRLLIVGGLVGAVIYMTMTQSHGTAMDVWAAARMFMMLGIPMAVASSFGVTLARPVRQAFASLILFGNPLFLIFARIICEVFCFWAELIAGYVGLPYVMYKFVRASVPLLNAASSLK